MVMTDPIADFLTRIRNAKQAGHRRLAMPASKLKTALAGILREEGYIREYKLVDEGPQGTLQLWLKYDAEGRPAIQGLKRISRPGLRRYVPNDELPRVLGGLGVAILSTSRGIMTGKSARKVGVGGEVLCFVW
jgi:small subunit ribosomal protein S8